VAETSYISNIYQLNEKLKKKKDDILQLKIAEQKFITENNL
jgi:hypothetical protein